MITYHGEGLVFNGICGRVTIAQSNAQRDAQDQDDRQAHAANNVPLLVVLERSDYVESHADDRVLSALIRVMSVLTVQRMKRNLHLNKKCFSLISLLHRPLLLNDVNPREMVQGHFRYTDLRNSTTPQSSRLFCVIAVTEYARNVEDITSD